MLGLRALGDLSPLRACRALKDLVLDRTSVSDVSPLRDLDQLTCLSLIDCIGVTDVWPLTRVVSLTELSLQYTSVSDVTCLAQCLNLEHLELEGCAAIHDVWALQSCLRLQALYLGDTGVHDLSSLRVLAQMKHSDAHGCAQLADLAVLEDWPNLETLDVSRTAVTDLSPIQQCPKHQIVQVDSTGITDRTPLARLACLSEFSANDCANLRDISPLEKCEALSQVHISSNAVSDLAPLGRLPVLTQVSASRCAYLCDISPLEGCRALSTLSIVDTTIANRGALANSPHLRSFKTTHEFYYQTLRCNINMLKLIQVGITLLNEKGEVPETCSTWQFNFRFNLRDDIYAQDSIDILENGGINFSCFAEYGIEHMRFAELLTSSGLLLNPDVHWLTFQAGYDFGYLTKVVCHKELPEREEDFQHLFHALFPTMFDLKYLLRSTERSFMGLDALAESLKLRRFGTAHQAGSDSLLTGHCYFRLLPESFHGQTPSQLNGVIYALSEDSASSATPSSASNMQLNNHHSATSIPHNSYSNGAAFPSAPMQGGNVRAK